MCSPGGFTPYRDVTCKDLSIFHEATKDLRGVTYKPFLVATQVGKGTHYRFICNSTTMTRPPQNAITMVCIFKPLCKEKEKEKEKEKAVVKGICRMSCIRD